MNKCFLLIISIVAFYSCNEGGIQKDVASGTIDSLKAENDSLKLELSNREQNIQLADTGSYTQSNRSEGKDQKKFVAESLRKKPELIPLAPILGGAMHFGEINVISDDLLIADYEDGHIMGQTLYEYEVLKTGEVKFKAIRSKEY